MATGISFGGLASGLDTEDMIEKLIHLERAPIRQMLARKNTQALRQAAWQDVTMLVTGLDSSLRALRISDTFDGRTATSSRSSLLSASATRIAAEGTYEIEIEQMAGVHRVAGDRLDSRTDPLGTEGIFVLAGTEIQVEQGDSLNDIVDRINAEEGGVRASVVDNRLLLTGQQTGAAHRIGLHDLSGNVLEDLGVLIGAEASAAVEGSTAGAIVGSEAGVPYTAGELESPVGIGGSEYRFGLVNSEGDVVAVSVDGFTYVALEQAVSLGELETATLSEEIFEFDHPVKDGAVTAIAGEGVLTLAGTAVANELAEARDAAFSIDGLQIASSSNTGIEGVIDGVTLNLGGVTSEGSVTLEISRDDGTTVRAVREFVAKYNQVASRLKELGGREALLQGDGTLRRLESGLRRLVMDNVGLEGAEYTSLGQLGIEIDREGVMTLDDAVLTEALRENPGDVRSLFMAQKDSDGIDGVARRLGEYIQGWIRSGDGILPRQEGLYDRRMQTIDDRVEGLERRVQMREANLRRQFVRMEQMLSTMHSQGQWLEGQINTLSSLRRDTK